MVYILALLERCILLKTRAVGNGFTWSTHLAHAKNLYLPKKPSFQTENVHALLKELFTGYTHLAHPEKNFTTKKIIILTPQNIFSNEKSFHTHLK